MAGKPTVPPRLTGPRMAVWGYFPFDGRVIDTAGTHADWDWAMRQWDRVAQAGPVVRLVVADQPYSRVDPGTTDGANRLSQLLARFDACRAAEQLVFGRVYVAGGKLSLGAVGAHLDDPLRPGHQVATVAEQIDAWHRLHGDRIDGIYLDSGPVDCTDPARPGNVPGIPDNYVGYQRFVRQFDTGYKLFAQVAQYPDNQPGNAWVRDRLKADFLELWEAGVLTYRTKFQARDACSPGANPGVPGWWDPGTAGRWSRVHVINDCRDADTMRTVADLAVRERAAGTVWITRSRQDPTLGSVFDVLPPYWDDEVAFFRAFLDQDEKEAKDGKDAKDEKEAKEAKDSKEEKEEKDDKDSKDDKEAKENKDAKDEPDAAEAQKNAKDEKDDPDQVKFDKDNKDNKDDKESKDEADAKFDKDQKEEKERKDSKDQMFEKEGETSLKGLERTGPGGPPRHESLPEAPEEAPADAQVPLGRTFIRPEERPEVGATIVADPAAPAGSTGSEPDRS
ncbi:hypothetical protein ACFV5G_09855 [Streptomyces sp. NPDC059766]|uniref:hypothetical protein n=1 Tax=Streptomyces sp. NPDC059766 TaxID=3346940 RepID=UPI00364F7952